MQFAEQSPAGVLEKLPVDASRTRLEIPTPAQRIGLLIRDAKLLHGSGVDDMTMTEITQRAQVETFRALHAPGSVLVLPNAWDGGSARVLEQVGFPAIATTSAGIAWSCGVPDGEALDLDAHDGHVDRRGVVQDRNDECAAGHDDFFAAKPGSNESGLLRRAR